MLFAIRQPVSDMPKVPVPASVSPSEILEAGSDQDVMRLEELAEEIDTNRSDLYKPLMELIERGDAAAFPVGGSVQVRFESGEKEADSA